MLQDIQVFVVTFCSILWEALPFIVLGAVIAGVLEELLPQQAIARVMPSYAVPAVAVGGLLGLVFPMCECGIVVVMRRLLKKGLPLSCCVAYMLAGPIVNVVVMLSTYAAFGGLGDDKDPARDALLKQAGLEMLALRAGLGFVVAAVTGLAVHALAQSVGPAELVAGAAAPKGGLSLDVVDKPADGPPARPTSPFRRLSNVSATALHDFMDITVFLVIGAVLASVAKLAIGKEDIEWVSQNQPLLAIPAMMLLAVVMCLCSEADAFVAASFTEMTTAPKLAFLVLGPMLDVKLLLMFTRVFRPRLIAVIVMFTVLQVLAYTSAVHAVYRLPADRADTSALPAPAPGVPPAPPVPPPTAPATPPTPATPPAE